MVKHLKKIGNEHNQETIMHVKSDGNAHYSHLNRSDKKAKKSIKVKCITICL
jgi:hypothetical protein